MSISMKKFYILLGLVLLCSGLAQAKETGTFYFTSHLRVFGTPVLLTQPAVFGGEFEVQDNLIIRQNFHMHLQEEGNRNAYVWFPELTPNYFGWIQNGTENLEIVITAKARIHVEEVENTALEGLGDQIRADVSLICPALPAEVNQKIECRVGRTSGFEIRDHDNPDLRSLEFEPLDNEHVQFAPVQVVRLR
jgi:hypothetical protein